MCEWCAGVVAKSLRSVVSGQLTRALPLSARKDAARARPHPWAGGRVVECTGLENRRGWKPTAGSNPAPPAGISKPIEITPVRAHNARAARGLSAAREHGVLALASEGPSSAAGTPAYRTGRSRSGRAQITRCCPCLRSPYLSRKGEGQSLRFLGHTNAAFFSSYGCNRSVDPASRFCISALTHYDTPSPG